MRRAFGTLLALAFCAASTAPFTGHAQEGLAPWDARDVGQQNGVFWTEFRGPNGDGASRSLDLPVEFGEEQHVRWKTAIHDRGFSSPVVWGDQVWMTTAREDGTELFAVCVDLDTGDIVHDIKVFDVAEPQLEYAHLNSHASPTPAVEEGRVYVHFGTYGTACLDTETGEQFWERRDLNCFHRVRAGSSPIVDDEALYVAYDGVDVQFVAALDKRTGDTRWLEDRGVESDLAAAMKALGFDDPADMRETAKEKPNDNKKSYATATLIEHEGRRQLISPAAEATI